MLLDSWQERIAIHLCIIQILSHQNLIYVRLFVFLLRGTLWNEETQEHNIESDLQTGVNISSDAN